MTKNFHPVRNLRFSNGAGKNLIFIAIIVAALIIAGAIIYVSQEKKTESPSPVALEETEQETGEPETTQLDEFAKCLTDKGAKFYGAYWCGHCKNQKELFGNSLQYVNYIECADTETGEWKENCTNAQITAVPTWEFADGERELGVQSLEKLAQISGCPL